MDFRQVHAIGLELLFPLNTQLISAGLRDRSCVVNITTSLNSRDAKLNGLKIGNKCGYKPDQNIKTEIHSILKVHAKGFRTEDMGWVYNFGDTENKNQIRAYPIGKKEHVVINIRTVLAGEQIIGYVEINNNQLEVYRTRMGDRIEKTAIEELKSIVSINLLRA